ncbi:hypothetical protein J1N35_005630, partial [Gossypium stocksii]
MFLLSSILARFPLGIFPFSNGDSLLDLAALWLNGGDEVGWTVDLGDLNNAPVEDFCVVSSFLTARVIHFQAMKTTLTNLWHPHDGVTISDLGDKSERFLALLRVACNDGLLTSVEASQKILRGEWWSELIWSLFPELLGQSILHILLGGHAVSDRWHWFLKDNGLACFWQDNISCSLTSEALACIRAIHFAQDLGFRNVELEGDSEVLISKLNVVDIDRSTISSIIWDAKRLVLGFEHFKFQHIKWMSIRFRRWWIVIGGGGFDFVAMITDLVIL